jgi:hypothetical protein
MSLQRKSYCFGFPYFKGEQTMSAQKRQPFGRRINTWLAEAPTEQFTDNKWRFWASLKPGNTH